MDEFDFDTAMKYISSSHRFGTKPGTARMDIIARESGLYDMLRGIKFIHIAGTNGKGSTAVSLQRILTNAGYRTGLYVSPHIHRFTERISVNGEEISESEFASCLSFFVPYIEKLDFEEYGDMKEFELITLAGLLYFARKRCEYVCLEVGIGGRLDATNIISPHIALILSISKDHTKVLGDTLEKIAFEKCGIIKDSIPVIAYPVQAGGVFDVIKSETKRHASELAIPEMPKKISVSESGTEFEYKNIKYKTSLVGVHQAYNAAVVIEAVKMLCTLGAEISKEDIDAGLSSISHPARFELVGKNPTVILDGAHNEGGMKALAESLALFAKEKPVAFVFGMCADHVDKAVLEAMPCKNSAVFTAGARDITRAMSADELAKRVSPYCKEAVPCKSIKEALSLAKEKAIESGGIVLCTGSLFIADEIKE